MDTQFKNYELTSRHLSRRQMLGLLGGGATIAFSMTCRASRNSKDSGRTLADDLVSSSATALARAIERKDVSSEEVVRAYLERIEEVNPKLNAVVQLIADAALKEAVNADANLARGEVKGPLHGVPMTIKDSLDTAGVISTAGTKGRASFVPDRDAAVVARLRSAGAILLGKTNTPELTLAGETDNLIYGRTNNPYDLERTPGGSSGGAASIIAASGSPFDIGSDTAGSIRVPSHYTGIVGIKPTSGRVPRTGHIICYDDAFESITTLGPMARYVEDLITVLPLIAGPDGEDPAIPPVGWKDPGHVNISRLKAALYTDNGLVPATQETALTVEKAGATLGDQGVDVVLDRPELIPLSMEIMFSAFMADGGAGTKRRLERAGTREAHPWIMEFINPDQATSAAEFGKRIERWATYRREMLAFMRNYDLILCPVVAHPAPLHRKPDEPANYATWYTFPYNLTGWPAAVVRCGTSKEGLPIGVQIVGRPWREDVVLAVAAYLETTMGGYKTPASR